MKLIKEASIRIPRMRLRIRATGTQFPNVQQTGCVRSVSHIGPEADIMFSGNPAHQSGMNLLYQDEMEYIDLI